MNPRGLTLVEVLVAIAVLTIMATTALPLLQDAARWSKTTKTSDVELEQRTFQWTPPEGEPLEDLFLDGGAELRVLDPRIDAEDHPRHWILVRKGELTVPRFLSRRPPPDEETEIEGGAVK